MGGLKRQLVLLQMAGAGFGTYLLVALIIWGSMAPILKAAKNEAFGAPSHSCYLSWRPCP